jgi:hypothetical protein
MTASPFPPERQDPVRPMREPAQSRQFRVLPLSQTAKDLAHHAVHAVRRLTIGIARPPRHLFRDFQFLHPISIYQPGASQKPFPSERTFANSFTVKVILFFSRSPISGDRQMNRF